MSIPYLIDTFRGGVSDENDKGLPGAFKHGYGVDIHARDDVLKAKPAMLTVFGDGDTTQTGITKFMVPASDGSTYFFTDTGSIFCRSGDGDFNFVYDDINGNIKGASEWGLDDDSKYIFWANDTSISRKPLPGSGMGASETVWADVELNWKTTLDSAEHHTMKVAAGQLNIANRRHLAVIEYDGDFDPSAMNIRPGNLIKTIEERDDFVILGSYREDDAELGHIWSWIVAADKWIQKKAIPVKGVNAVISTEFFLLQGGNDGEIFSSDFVDATPLHGIPGGGRADPGGVSIEDGIATFGIYGGDYPGLWSYGRKRLNRPKTLNYAYRLQPTVDGSTISTISAVAMVGGTLLASWGTTDESTSDYGIDAVSTTTKANALYEGLEFSGGAPNLKKKYEHVKLVVSPFPSGASLAVKIQEEKTGVWKYGLYDGENSMFSVADVTEIIFSVDPFTKTYEVGVELFSHENTSPEVLAIISAISEETADYA